MASMCQSLRGRRAERRKAMETGVTQTAVVANGYVAEGQNAERQWRLPHSVCGLSTTKRGRRAERRKAMETPPHLPAPDSPALWPKGRTPKGKGDLPSGFWVLGLEAEDVVAGEQNIERQ